jgi:hypothetical protein
MANPIPDSQANTGFTWPLLPVVWSGTVAGALGSRPPIAAIVVVGAGAGAVVGGTETVWSDACREAGGA